MRKNALKARMYIIIRDGMKRMEVPREAPFVHKKNVSMNTTVTIEYQIKF